MKDVDTIEILFCFKDHSSVSYFKSKSKYLVTLFLLFKYF